MTFIDEHPELATRLNSLVDNEARRLAGIGGSYMLHWNEALANVACFLLGRVEGMER